MQSMTLVVWNECTSARLYLRSHINQIIIIITIRHFWRMQYSTFFKFFTIHHLLQKRCSMVFHLYHLLGHHSSIFIHPSMTDIRAIIVSSHAIKERLTNEIIFVSSDSFIGCCIQVSISSRMLGNNK